MDDIDLTGLRTKAANSGTELANLTGNAPNLLNEFKSSLTSAFAKDNPLIQERDTKLSTFLSTPATTRAQLLPQNLPQVEGSFLNLSPTQQNAIVTSRYNAALAPLLGLNQAVTAGYGGIGDVVQGAGTGLQALIQAESLRNQQAQQAFENAMAQAQEQRMLEESRKKGAGTGFDLASMLALIQGSQPQPTPERPPIESFDQPDQVQNIEIPGQGVIQPYTPAPVSGPSSRWNPFAQLAAIPEALFGRKSISTTQPSTSLNLLGQQSYGPFRQ